MPWGWVSPWESTRHHSKWLNFKFLSQALSFTLQDVCVEFFILIKFSQCTSHTLSRTVAVRPNLICNVIMVRQRKMFWVHCKIIFWLNLGFFCDIKNTCCIFSVLWTYRDWDENRQTTTKMFLLSHRAGSAGSILVRCSVDDEGYRDWKDLGEGHALVGCATLRQHWVTSRRESECFVCNIVSSKFLKFDKCFLEQAKEKIWHFWRAWGGNSSWIQMKWDLNLVFKYRYQCHHHTSTIHRHEMSECREMRTFFN